MSYTPKQLAVSIPDKSKEGLIELMTMEKVFTLKSFKKVMFNPKLSVERKQEIVNDILANNFSKNTIKFINFLLEENTLQIFDKILSEFKKILRVKKIALSGTITSAESLSSEEIKKAEADLEVRMSVPVVLESKISPELLGGVILEIDGLSYDNSFQRKLSMLKL